MKFQTKNKQGEWIDISPGASLSSLTGSVHHLLEMTQILPDGEVQVQITCKGEVYDYHLIKNLWSKDEVKALYGL